MQTLRYLLTATVLGWLSPSFTQSSFSECLAAVERNNQSLLAAQKSAVATRLAARTGIAPEDPELFVQYLIGSPADAGDQLELLAIQRFDLPMVYRKKRQLAELGGLLSERNVAMERRQILAEASRLLLNMVLLNRQAELFRRQEAVWEKWVNHEERQLAQGASGILALRKAQMQHQEARQLSSKNELALQECMVQLKVMNGGVPMEFRDTVYPEFPDPGSLQTLEQAIEAADPALLHLETQRQLADRQLDLVGLQQLPQLEAGYRHQSLLGQRYHGLHAGLSLPLWENNGKRAARRAELDAAEARLVAHRQEHHASIQMVYDRQKLLGEQLRSFREAFDQDEIEALLEKAYLLGEWSSREYFQELGFYQERRHQLLKLEWEYVVALAQLSEYRL
ncbi:MAG: TolC family protein [Saprospiraceae bacterium]|nr:TolC family protein [Saprospiraceae bacterium]